MMRKTILASLFLLALFACAAAAPYAKPLSKLDVRHMPQPVATQAVLDQAMDLLRHDSPLTEKDRRAALLAVFSTVADDTTILTPEWLSARTDAQIRDALDRLAQVAIFAPDPMAGPHPHTSLHEYTLSRPFRAAAYAGLCVEDDVTVLFSPIGRDAGADAPVRASEIVADHYYRMLAPLPTAPVMPKMAPQARAGAEQTCAALGSIKDGGAFFSAPSDDAAVQGLWLATTVLAAARSGRPEFDLRCGRGTTAECAAEIAGERPVLYSADGCEPLGPSRRMCTVAIERYKFDVMLAEGASDTIVSVDVSEYVILAHYRAD